MVYQIQEGHCRPLLFTAITDTSAGLRSYNIGL